jgi:hypothetical protein
MPRVFSCSAKQGNSHRQVRRETSKRLLFQKCACLITKEKLRPMAVFARCACVSKFALGKITGVKRIVPRNSTWFPSMNE